jgi:ankyrin repeat protein
MCPHSEVTMALLQAGADVNVAESTGDTAIVIAATESQFGRNERTSEEGRANPNAQGMGGETALHYAALSSLLERVELLLQYGSACDVARRKGPRRLPQQAPWVREGALG